MQQLSATNRLLSDVSLPILRELVPHYLQESGKVCFFTSLFFTASTYFVPEYFLYGGTFVVIGSSRNSNFYTGENGLPGGWKNCFQVAFKALLVIVSR